MDRSATARQARLYPSSRRARLHLAPGSPDAFAAILRRDYDRYARIIRAAGIRAE